MSRIEDSRLWAEDSLTLSHIHEIVRYQAHMALEIGEDHSSVIIRGWPVSTGPGREEVTMVRTQFRTSQLR